MLRLQPDIRGWLLEGNEARVSIGEISTTVVLVCRSNGSQGGWDLDPTKSTVPYPTSFGRRYLAKLSTEWTYIVALVSVLALPLPFTSTEKHRDSGVGSRESVECNRSAWNETKAERASRQDHNKAKQLHPQELAPMRARKCSPYMHMYVLWTERTVSGRIQPVPAAG
jgi:hypothetical protein